MESESGTIEESRLIVFFFSQTNVGGCRWGCMKGLEVRCYVVDSLLPSKGDGVTTYVFFGGLYSKGITRPYSQTTREGPFARPIFPGQQRAFFLRVKSEPVQ